MGPLLDRREFRELVLRRDGRCVACGAGDRPLDAHHVMERRLFPDGGYYLDNGASLCEAGVDGCHYRAEQTALSVEDVLAKAGIRRRVTPPHLYPDQKYDKWGNPVLDDGRRLRGELFHDESVQKVLASGGVLHLFTKYVKYPRTFHLPWSPNVSSDDRMLKDDSIFFGPTPEDYTDVEEILEGVQSAGSPREVVVTLKMDGENTTWYNDYMHARSLEYEPHPSRDRIKALWAERCYDIPDGWRVCGENLYAKHSIAYDDLPGYFMVFSVWNGQNECLPWDETVEWAQLLGLPTVPVVYRGPYTRLIIETAYDPALAARHEGYVVRNAGRFHYREFRKNVAKFVRKGHVQSHGHWMRRQVVPNRLQEVP